MSKRALESNAAAEEKQQRAAEVVDDEEIAQTTRAAPTPQMEAEAASQLALIASPANSPAKRAPAEADTSYASYASSSSSLPPASPAPSSSSVVSQLARLTPEQITKLRRMQKLRALLTKLPPGTKLPPPRQPAAASADAPEPDAIAMLASVACR